jgi:hypothetical protein
MSSDSDRALGAGSLFVRLINHQPAVLFSQNKSAPAISHQPNEQAVGLFPHAASPGSLVLGQAVLILPYDSRLLLPATTS